MPGGFKSSDRALRLPRDWQTIRKRVLARDKAVCQINMRGCQNQATEVDHVIAGDDHTDTNLRAACTHCHRHKTAREGVQARASIRARRFRLTPPPPGLRETP